VGSLVCVSVCSLPINRHSFTIKAKNISLLLVGELSKAQQ